MDCRRELDDHHGSVSITPCLSSDRAAVSVNYSAADGKTKPRPARLGAKERVEDVRTDSFGYSCARVRDLRDNPGILLPGSPSDSNCEFSVTLNGFDSIDKQIEKELLQLWYVRDDEGTWILEVTRHCDTGLF